MQRTFPLTTVLKNLLIHSLSEDSIKNCLFCLFIHYFIHYSLFYSAYLLIHSTNIPIEDSIKKVVAKAILFRYSSHHRANPDPTIGIKICKYLCE